MVLRFFTVLQPQTGQEANPYTITLYNAHIASIDFRMPDPTEGSTRPEYEHIALTYQRIEFRWNDGGVTSIGDWAREV